MMVSGRRSGFTLVELMVVIAIIGILIGLLIPAVGAAREAARRVSCSNNMHQLALAVHSYHGVYEGFPPGSSLANESATAWGMMALLMPFIEEQAKYDTIDFEAASQNPCRYIRELQDAGKPNPSDQPITAALCPSDPNSSLSLISGPLGPTPNSYPCGLLYPTSYLGMAGTRDPNITGTYSGCVSQVLFGDGMFYTNSATRFATLKDGSSQTLMFGERVIPMDLGWGWPLAGGTECEHYVSSAMGIFMGNYDPNEYFIHVQHYWSWHPGGIYTSFADGSVKFLSYNIDYTTYTSLTTVNGLEIVQ